MASPPSPPRPLVATTSPTKKLQPMPWTHQETLNLIKAYQEKWYSLNRGQLRTNQWEEVAVTVAARCGYDYNEPSKSAIQCRHKMEKLRQRYRAEKQRLATASASSGSRAVCSSWQYYQLMENLELGPLPISARPLAPCSYNTEDFNVNSDDSDDMLQEKEDEEEEEYDIYSKSRSVNRVLQKRWPNFGDGFNGRRDGVTRDSNEKKRWNFVKDEMEDEEEEKKRGKGKDLISELAAEIRTFGERFIGLQNLQMEITKETERCRLQMENKRTEMILKSQQRTVASIEKVFGLSKKMKISRDV